MAPPCWLIIKAAGPRPVPLTQGCTAEEGGAHSTTHARSSLLDPTMKTECQQSHSLRTKKCELCISVAQPPHSNRQGRNSINVSWTEEGRAGAHLIHKLLCASSSHAMQVPGIRPWKSKKRSCSDAARSRWLTSTTPENSESPRQLGCLVWCMLHARKPADL